MAKDSRSFFERLTGSVKIEDQEPEDQTIEIAEPRPVVGRTFKAPSVRMAPKKRTGRVLQEEEEAVEEPQFFSKTNQQEEVPEEDDEMSVVPGKDSAEKAEVLPDDQEVEGQLTVDIYDDGERIVIQSTVAGVRPEDLDVSITNDMVTIRGRRRKPDAIKEENYYYRELYWGAFSRSVILPEEIEVDKSEASLKNGLLVVKLPKKNKNVTQKIKVKME